MGVQNNDCTFTLTCPTGNEVVAFTSRIVNPVPSCHALTFETPNCANGIAVRVTNDKNDGEMLPWSVIPVKSTKKFTLVPCECIHLFEPETHQHYRTNRLTFLLSATAVGGTIDIETDKAELWKDSAGQLKNVLVHLFAHAISKSVPHANDPILVVSTANE